MFRTHFIKGDLAEKTLFQLYSNMLTRIKALSKKIYFYLKSNYFPEKQSSGARQHSAIFYQSRQICYRPIS